ncbi:MAG: DNA-directed RNA polymerase subunit beta [Lentisphaeria bacterium]|nr:DNA-directed RNA polymerase subunit beta [Lentisphaeria bacterium]MBR2625914.1 DNA-directed RNA polymerase subunit beta [Lentisphaeria bacterium]
MAERKNFGQLHDVLEMPDLIGLQVDSYDNFLQRFVPPAERKRQGLQEVFMEIFPIESFDKNMSLEFVSYEIGECPPQKSDVIDCIKDGKIYDAPLYVNFLLKVKDMEIPERVFMGDIPIMTEQGTFIINGAERVIISQLHRSPGICFEKNRHTSGRMLYSYRVIPDRGSWMDVQFDQSGLIQIYLDRRRRRRKFYITTFFRAIGYPTNHDILKEFYTLKNIKVSTLLKEKDLSKYYTVDNVTNEAEEVIVGELLPLNEKSLSDLHNSGIESVEVAVVPPNEDYIFATMRKDPARNEDEALKAIYQRMRPGDPINYNNAKLLIKRLFFDNRRYDLGMVGRYKLNERLKLDIPADFRTLDPRDLIEATKMLIDLHHTNGPVDDIDHLGARRIRTVGELLQNQCRAGLLRTERLIRERMTMEDANISPSKLINPKTFAGVVRDFFARSQLSQFMDQNNPLSELTNKRRFSALGPGGLSRDRAGFEVRDVHSSHYGRICPIETPEGPNIGLISSMALYAIIDEYGFLETPYRKVVNGQVTDIIDYLTADKEEKFVIAQANALLDENNRFVRDMVMCRKEGESAEHPRETIDYMDVSPKQLVSAAAGIIPFLEHDDANRALMGSNMQRQAVPLLMPDSPYVGTGLEKRIARDSRAVIVAREDGVVAEVCSEHIIVTPDGSMPTDEVKGRTYRLYKYLRSNAGTCINQRPRVRRGDVVKKGDLLADGAATSGGELALGRNVLVAFMPWCGYNFEDAIIVSERLVKEDVYTSVHVDEFEITSRDTKLGPEEITRDIPNVGEDALRNLDSRGIVIEGAEVKPGDILVGKITPKSETELAPEERLLRAIFGEKAADVKDSSLTVSSGKGGIVMDIRADYVKDTPAKSGMTKTEKKSQEKALRNEYRENNNAILADLTERLSELMLGVKIPVAIVDGADPERKVLVPANRKITRSPIQKLAAHYNSWEMEDCDVKNAIAAIIDSFKERFEENEARLHSLDSDRTDDEQGTIKRVKVYVACKRKLQVGDKMAGRHGNKGIVSRIVPVEDMPFLEDGTPVDIVLNPLGVPSRMNIGQVLETHLGWAAKMLGIKIATPVFDGASEQDIVSMMEKANEKFAEENGKNYHWGFARQADGSYVYDGKADVYDGRTGDRFDQRVMVGEIYMLKLDHLVANKIHARAVGPYSLVTQQPLGGKAQHGGQRFGEMEVWALEAYGAAYNLQEMLTVKSDDVNGRSKIYELIVKGHNVLTAGRPESFNVLLKEMQSLGLDIRTVRGGDDR